MKNTLVSIALIIIAVAIGLGIGYFVFKCKAPQIIEVEKIVLVPEYRDTCFGTSIDSMEIYRTVRRGLVRKVTPVVTEQVVSTDPVENLYTLYHEEAFAQITVYADVKGTLTDAVFEVRVDTQEILRKYNYVDTVMIQLPPQIIPIEVNTIQVVEKLYNQRMVGFEVEGGVNPQGFTTPFAKGGLFYQDRKMRRYGVNYSTDSRASLSVGVPLIKFK